MARGQGQIGPNIAGIIRARDSLSDHKRPKSGKVWKGTPPPGLPAPPRSEQLRPSLILTNISGTMLSSLRSLWYKQRVEVLGVRLAVV